ncbi:DeoR/GlpR family DNA-binding transcription regulator [Aeribacillus pallidus]|uniref:HTH deoR-type domain-containing protein n=1 Tax=Aeribacillus pallidus TaxID=33936 RepID=A0A223EAJ5_9BACI|nr:DeoR/GlpR family DNA-binding transcription regulator [Aeribacillus pallidus]ASS92266.1 hypothetical protein AP3564_04665 [Aeribacillus pallidus]
MLAQERYEEILRLLEKDKIVKVAQLCSIFNVSVETVRRDLEFLEKEGKLKRVYGGAVLERKLSMEPSYHTRVIGNAREKQSIGKKTAELIHDGETLIIDLGTTTLEVAKHLKDKKDLTIITNCLYIAQELVDVPGYRVILSGGQLRSEEQSTSGFMSEEFFRTFNVDKTIIGVGGITIEEGITDYHLEETRVRRIMIEKGSQVIAVADHSKFGVKALVNVCPLEDIDVLVTDDKLPKSIIEKFKKQNVNVIVAED